MTDQGEPPLEIPALLAGRPADLHGTAEARESIVPLRALQDVLALRRRQILEFGHTPVDDLRRPAEALPRAARQALQDAIEDLQFNKDRAQIRRRLVKAASLTLAAIDRIDNEGDGN